MAGKLKLTNDVVSKSIDGITDLVIWAPIKEGFIDAFENVTYETRLHLVAEALHKIRTSSREHETLSPFSDTAERILTLLDFRIGVVSQDLFQTKGKEADGSISLKPRRFMYLVATFDGPWEPYMRLIWKPLGPFLDLLLCNCEGYITAEDNSFEEYSKWVRNNQLDASIFYSTTGLTVKDQNYLSKFEQVQREGNPATLDLELARLTSDDPTVKALELRNSKEGFKKTTSLALEALTVLYKLADFYPPDRLVPSADHPDAEGRYLLRAAHDLLHDWSLDCFPDPVLKAKLEKIYEKPLWWFNLGRQDGSPPSDNPDEPDRKEVQKGLLTSYDHDGPNVPYGAFLLLQISDVEKFKSFLGAFPFSWEDCGDGKLPEDSVLGCVFRNIAFAHRGLAHLGLSNDELMEFPVEFRQGMQERGPLLGDMGESHPRKWKLPERNWPAATGGSIIPRPPVELKEVDLAIQLRSSNAGPHGKEGFIKFSEIASQCDFAWLDSKGKVDLDLLKESVDCKKYSPLEILISLIGNHGDQLGLSLLAIEDMYRTIVEGDNTPLNVGHFGFKDGLSQPKPVKDPQAVDEVPFGDLLYGYDNNLGTYQANTEGLMFNGSFLAVRKLRQDVTELNKTLAKYEVPEGTCPAAGQFGHGELAARMMGRYRDGTPLISPANGNDFDYDNDKQGDQCPFASHIRRTNPRDVFQGRKAPRILRRGMTYGPRYKNDEEADRGLIFMAYNANLAEQFEIIQRWINGANSTNVSATQNDPIIANVSDGNPKTFRFTMNGEVQRVVIDKPFVELEWGEYFFVPSKSTISKLAKSTSARDDELAERVETGNEIIHRLFALDDDTQRIEWKIVLEDFLSKDPDERSAGPDVWEAIIDNGGALRVDSGLAKNVGSSDGESDEEERNPVVLVGSEELIMGVLSDDEHFSVKVQDKRSQESCGSIFVTQDPDEQYYKEANATNEILINFSEKEAFDDAYKVATQVLNIAKAAATDLNAPSLKLELRRQFLRPALAGICSIWFGIPDGEKPGTEGKYFGASDWEWDRTENSKPVCPGDYMAPSRYIFYPRPTPAITAYGLAHGKGLNEAAEKLIADSRKKPPQTKIFTQMIAAIDDDDILARNLIGIMIGALPPVDGNLRGILFDWINNDTFWNHQGALHRKTSGKATDYASANEVLRPAIAHSMSRRPAPDLIYRTALKDTALGTGEGEVTVKAGDTLVLGLTAATQHRLNTGQPPNVEMIFGGERKGVKQPKECPVHACPAYKISMGMMMGILAALLDSGKIKVLPASLILEISDWKL